MTLKLSKWGNKSLIFCLLLILTQSFARLHVEQEQNHSLRQTENFITIIMLITTSKKLSMRGFSLLDWDGVETVGSVVL